MREVLPRVVTVVALVIATSTVAIRSFRSGARDSVGASRAAVVLEPSADNVAPVFHTREMSLRSRLASNAADTAVMRELADLLADAHDAVGSLEYRKRYTELAPDHRQGWIELAATAVLAGDGAGAKAAMLSLLERVPEDPTALYNLGAIEANAGDTAAAVVWWKRAVAQSADPAIASAARAALSRIGSR